MLTKRFTPEGISSKSILNQLGNCCVLIPVPRTHHYFCRQDRSYIYNTNCDGLYLVTDQNSDLGRKGEGHLYIRPKVSYLIDINKRTMYNTYIVVYKVHVRV